MKTRHLLIALSLSTFTIANILHYTTLAQPNQSEIEPLTTATAQQAAAKITVRIQAGESGGSGVIIGKKGNTYLVLTNAHVVREQSGIKIKTPDGQTYTAQKVKNTQVGNFDLALLEFSSTRSYQLAGLKNFGNGEAALNEGREIFTAGFPYDSNALRVVMGEVTQLPQEPFINGTQIGYVTKSDVKQGMSGGPILDSFGNLVGINSTLARPVIDSYTYTDGTKAPKDKIAEYRQANWSVPIYNLLTRLNPDILYSYKDLPKLQRAVTPTGYMGQLDRQARLVTVRIENADGNGSGVIVARDGNSYYVLTAEHVVKNTRNLKLTTHGQRTYQINPGDIKRSIGTDLAIVKFTSTQPYRVATLGNYDILNNSLVFPGGWPAPKNINSQQWQWGLNPGSVSSQEQGQFQTQDKQSFSNGYDLIYSSVTYGGMSGGPVFDRAGRVIGIHGRSESGGLVGQSLGISVKTFLGLADKLGVNQSKLEVKNTVPPTLDNSKLASVRLVLNNIPIPNNNSSAEQWTEYGNQLNRLGEFGDAVKAFDRSIALESTAIAAHYGKGLALWNIGNNLGAIQAYDRAIALVPSGSQRKFYYLWKYRSISLKSLRKYPEALSSISQAISLEPQDIILLNQKAILLEDLKRYPESIAIYDSIIAKEPKTWAYSNRGNAKSDLGDKKGAIADYNLAIELNPQFAVAYTNRGFVKSDLGDHQGAIADYNIALKLNPQSVETYTNRGNAKSALGDKKGSLLDYNIALQIDPKYAQAYSNRGNSKSKLGDSKGALADYNLAIRFNPQYANAYTNRGGTKSALGDKKGAIADYNIALQLNPKSIETYVNRGIAKFGLGDTKGAIEDYNIALRINPKFAAAYTNRGFAKYNKLNDEKGAMEDYNTALSIDPQFAEAYNNRGILKYRSGDKQGAIADYNLAIKIDPQYADAYGNRANVKSDLGDKKGAIADYDIAFKLSPQSAEAYFIRGTEKSKLGDKKGAIADYDRAIQLDPQLAKAYISRGIIKANIGDKQGAIADYTIAIRIDPQNDKAYYNRGVDRAAIGDKKGAIDDYTSAIKIDPKFALAYYTRGNAKSAMGDKKGAIIDYDRAIRIEPQAAPIYANRGIAKSELGDKQGAIADLNTAAKLFKVQNNRGSYDRAMSLIEKLSN